MMTSPQIAIRGEQDRVIYLDKGDRYNTLKKLFMSNKIRIGPNNELTEQLHLPEESSDKIDALLYAYRLIESG